MSHLALIEAQEDLEQAQLEERRDALTGCMKKLRERDQDLPEPATAIDRHPDVAVARGRSAQSIHNRCAIRRALSSACAAP